jgi:hypothetical protein
MRVIIQLQKDAAAALQQGQSASPEIASATRAVLDAAAELDVRLEPMHPGQTHPLLAPYFTVEVPDNEASQRVIDRLSQFAIVEAAYVKPDEQLP